MLTVILLNVWHSNKLPWEWYSRALLLSPFCFSGLPNMSLVARGETWECSRSADVSSKTIYDILRPIIGWGLGLHCVAILLTVFLSICFNLCVLFEFVRKLEGTCTGKATPFVAKCSESVNQMAFSAKSSSGRHPILVFLEVHLVEIERWVCLVHPSHKYQKIFTHIHSQSLYCDGSFPRFSARIGWWENLQDNQDTS